jgi:hypothetical protein
MDLTSICAMIEMFLQNSRLQDSDPCVKTSPVTYLIFSFGNKRISRTFACGSPALLSKFVILLMPGLTAVDACRHDGYALRRKVKKEDAWRIEGNERCMRPG